MPRLLTKRQAADRLGFHPEHLMRLAREGRFPAPIKTGNAVNCRVLFVSEEVEAWIAARMAERRHQRQPEPAGVAA